MFRYENKVFYNLYLKFWIFFFYIFISFFYSIPRASNWRRVGRIRCPQYKSLWSREYNKISHKICQFLRTQNQILKLFSDAVWLQNLFFLVNVTKHVNDLHLNIQAKVHIITVIYDQVNHSIVSHLIEKSSRKMKI